jgi:hypothetical protein
MSSELQKSVKNLISVKEDRKKLDDFAKARYNENFPRDPKKFDQGWHHYDKCVIIDENTISVEYKYGAGDYDYSGNFNVDLIPYYRDEKLENIK